MGHLSDRLPSQEWFRFYGRLHMCSGIAGTFRRYQGIYFLCTLRKYDKKSFNHGRRRNQLIRIVFVRQRSSC